MAADPSLERLALSWKLSLEAGNKAPRTIETYLDALRLFVDWLEQNGQPTTIRAIERAHISGFVADQVARHRPSTASVRYRGLRVFFKWAVDEDEIATSPMAKMSPPIVPEIPVGIVSDDDMRKLLKLCDGKTFEDRRDTAIMRLFFDTGIRRAELACLAVTDIDLDHRSVTVLGKGRRPRTVPFGTNTAKALDRWLRVRDGHALASTPALWLGSQNRGFHDVAVRQMLERRGAQAGVSGLHAHAFRHGFAHAHLSEGGHESDLMMLAGWKSRDMLSRYGASVAVERAKNNYRSPGDRL